jgi:glycosyltransferase involved in cell wall biosynthesis
MPVKIAAKVDKADRDYYEEVIEPMLGSAHVEFIGEVGEEEKNELLGNAYAFLFPIDWPEPFGLSMAEAMATGTPVIATPFGSVPEIIEDGKNGFIVNSVDEAVDAVDKVARLDRHTVYEVFKERFSAHRMASDYVKLYQRLPSGRPQAARVPGVAPGAAIGAMPLGVPSAWPVEVPISPQNGQPADNTSAGASAH